jgi:hypothetical protein
MKERPREIIEIQSFKSGQRFVYAGDSVEAKKRELNRWRIEHDRNGYGTELERELQRSYKPESKSDGYRNAGRPRKNQPFGGLGKGGL